MRNQASASCCQHAGIGMVQGSMQQMYEVYPAQTAIRKGTLYPELDKPMSCAPAPTGCAQTSAGQELSFMAWEVRLYLNTHPNDSGALQFFQQLCQRLGGHGYACAFAPCDAGDTWRWVDDPWPWEVCANERRA